MTQIKDTIRVFKCDKCGTLKTTVETYIIGTEKEPFDCSIQMGLNKACDGLYEYIGNMITVNREEEEK